MKVKFLFFLLTMAVGLSSCFDSDDQNAQLNNEIREIDTYLNSIGTLEFIYYDPSGIRVVVHTFGEGVPPRQGQTVKASHLGILFSDGSVFTTNTLIDNKIENIAPESLRFGLSILPRGSQATIYTPSAYGYGSAGTTGVPPNSILIYQIELNDIIRTPIEEQRFKTDSAAIHNYLIDNTLEATPHSSGIWYTIDEPGTGGSPHLFNTVTFDYKVRVLNSTSTVDEGTLTNQFLSSPDLIDGMTAAIPLMQPGGTSTIYMPSHLAFGAAGKGNIPPNANVVFEITLKTIDQ